MPRNGFPFAILVSSQPNNIRTIGKFFQLADNFLFIGHHFIYRFEVVVYLNAKFFGGKIAHMAEAFNLPVVSHLTPELQVHTVAAVPNGLTVEYMPWSTGLYEEVPKMDKGELAVPTKPGLGLAFDQEKLKHYSIA